jgi:hypothetical protein
MRIIGCDLHARQQTLAMLDTATGEVVNETLAHEGEIVREFHSRLPSPVRVGIEATHEVVFEPQNIGCMGCLLGVSESASAEFSFSTPSAPPLTYTFKLIKT